MLLLSQGCALQMLRCSKSLCSFQGMGEVIGMDLPAVWSGFTEILAGSRLEAGPD